MKIINLSDFGACNPAHAMMYSSHGRAAHAYLYVGPGTYVIDDFGNSIKVDADQVRAHLRQAH